MWFWAFNKIMIVFIFTVYIVWQGQLATEQEGKEEEEVIPAKSRDNTEVGAESDGEEKKDEEKPIVDSELELKSREGADIEAIEDEVYVCDPFQSSFI